MTHEEYIIHLDNKIKHLKEDLKFTDKSLDLLWEIVKKHIEGYE